MTSKVPAASSAAKAEKVAAAMAKEAWFADRAAEIRATIGAATVSGATCVGSGQYAQVRVKVPGGVLKESFAVSGKREAKTILVNLFGPAGLAQLRDEAVARVADSIFLHGALKDALERAILGDPLRPECEAVVRAVTERLDTLKDNGVAEAKAKRHVRGMLARRVKKHLLGAFEDGMTLEEVVALAQETFEEAAAKGVHES